jgi:hypothetical protein
MKGEESNKFIEIQLCFRYERIPDIGIRFGVSNGIFINRQSAYLTLGAKLFPQYSSSVNPVTVLSAFIAA